MTTLERVETLIFHGSVELRHRGEHNDVYDALRMLALEIDELKTSLEEVSNIAKSAMPAFDTNRVDEST